MADSFLGGGLAAVVQIDVFGWREASGGHVQEDVLALVGTFFGGGHDASSSSASLMDSRTESSSVGA